MGIGEPEIDQELEELEIVPEPVDHYKMKKLVSDKLSKRLQPNINVNRHGADHLFGTVVAEYNKQNLPWWRRNATEWTGVSWWWRRASDTEKGYQITTIPTTRTRECKQ